MMSFDSFSAREMFGDKPTNPLTPDESKRLDKISAGQKAGQKISADDAAFAVALAERMRGRLPPVVEAIATDLRDDLGLDDFVLAVSRDVRHPLGPMTIDGIRWPLPSPIAICTHSQRAALDSWRENKLAQQWRAFEEGVRIELRHVDEERRAAMVAERLDSQIARWRADRMSFIFIEGEARFDLRAVGRIAGLLIEERDRPVCESFVGACGPRLLTAWWQAEEARAARAWANTEGRAPFTRENRPTTLLSALLQERAQRNAQRAASTLGETLSWWASRVAAHRVEVPELRREMEFENEVSE